MRDTEDRKENVAGEGRNKTAVGEGEQGNESVIVTESGTPAGHDEINLPGRLPQRCIDCAKYRKVFEEQIMALHLFFRIG